MSKSIWLRLRARGPLKPIRTEEGGLPEPDNAETVRRLRAALSEALKDKEEIERHRDALLRRVYSLERSESLRSPLSMIVDADEIAGKLDNLIRRMRGK